jgi:predicted nucleotidyltransferase
MERNIIHFSKREKQALSALLKQLKNDFQGQVSQIVLFGSKARGDARVDSDIDVLIVVENEVWGIKSKILQLGARLSLEFDVLFNLFIVGENRWQYMKDIQFPIYRVIAEEGVSIDQIPMGAHRDQ